MKTLWLIGMMGAGKTTVGRLVAEGAGVEFADLDDDVEALAGLSVSDLFAQQGETAFRALEAEAVARRAGNRCVVVCGGGVVLDDRNRDLMRSSGHVVWLDAPDEVLTRRLGDGAGRPLLAGGIGRRLEQLAAQRRHLYEGTAHSRVDAEGTPEDVAARVEAAWNAP